MKGLGGFMTNPNDARLMPIWYEKEGTRQNPDFGTIMTIDFHRRSDFKEGIQNGSAMPALPEAVYLLKSGVPLAPLTLMLCVKLTCLPYRGEKRAQECEDIKWLVAQVDKEAAADREYYNGADGKSRPQWTQGWKVTPPVVAPKLGEKAKAPARTMVEDGDEAGLTLWRRARVVWAQQTDLGDGKSVCFEKELGARTYLPKPDREPIPSDAGKGKTKV